jgi:hypothetical protein
MHGGDPLIMQKSVAAFAFGGLLAAQFETGLRGPTGHRP